MLKISGYSDDIVSIEGDISDEISAMKRVATLVIGSNATGGLVVRMAYSPKWSPDSTWVATVAQVTEDAEIPWPVRIVHGRKDSGDVYHSVVVEIDCPPGTPVECRGKQYPRSAS